MDAHIALLRDLKRTSDRWNASSVVIEDYNLALKRSLDLEVRISQLQKESQGLLDENATKGSQLESLTAEVKDIKRQVSIACEERKSQNTGLLQELNACKEEASLTKMELEETKSKLASAKVENDALTKDLAKEKDSTALIVAELQGNKAERDEALQKITRLETENVSLFNNLRDSHVTLLEKLEVVQELEQMVQTKRLEVERIRAQLDLEREMLNPLNISSILKRKTNPYAMRLQVIAVVLEKGQSNKALQALESLIVELQAGGGSSKGVGMFGGKQDVICVDDEEDEPLAKYKSDQLTIPMRPHLTHATHQGGCTSCSVFQTGNLVVTTGLNHKVLIWDPSRAIVQSALDGPKETIYDISFTCNESRILGACVNKSVVVWNSAKKEYYVMTGHTRGVNCVAAHPVDRYRAVSSGEDRYIRFWDLKRGFQIINKQIALQEHSTAVCFTSEGQIAAGGVRGGLRIWDVRSSELLMEYEGLHSDMVVALYPMPRSSNLLLSAGKDNVLKVFDFRNQSVVKSFSCAGYVLATVGYMGKGKCCLGISRDEQFITAGTMSGHVLVWRASEENEKSPPQVLQTEHHQDAVVATAWCNDKIMSCDKAGKVIIWH